MSEKSAVLRNRSCHPFETQSHRMLEKLIQFTDRSAPSLSSANADAFENVASMIYPAGTFWARALITTAPLESRFVLPIGLDDALFALRTHRVGAIFVDPQVSNDHFAAMRCVTSARNLPCRFVAIEDSAQRERVVWLLQQRIIHQTIAIPFRPRLLQTLLACDRAPTSEAALLLTSDVDLADAVGERLPDVNIIECNSNPALNTHLRNSSISAVLVDIDVDLAILMQAIATVRHSAAALRLIGLRRAPDTGRDAYLLGREGFNRIVTMPAAADTLRAACFGRRYEAGAFLAGAR